MVDAYARLIIEPNEEHDEFGSRAPIPLDHFPDLIINCSDGSCIRGLRLRS
jgi:hypothetical protein